MAGCPFQSSVQSEKDNDGQMEWVTDLDGHGLYGLMGQTI